MGTVGAVVGVGGVGVVVGVGAVDAVCACCCIWCKCSRWCVLVQVDLVTMVGVVVGWGDGSWSLHYNVNFY